VQHLKLGLQSLQDVRLESQCNC